MISRWQRSLMNWPISIENIQLYVWSSNSGLNRGWMRSFLLFVVFLELVCIRQLPQFESWIWQGYSSFQTCHSTRPWIRLSLHLVGKWIFSYRWTWTSHGLLSSGDSTQCSQLQSLVITSWSVDKWPSSPCCRNGVAMVYLKQEKFTSAEFHFTKATHLFRTNPDLICHLAVVREENSNEQLLDYRCSFRLNTNVIDRKVH